MAHLQISELVNLADSFYICLFGMDTYLRWKKIKTNSHCESEHGFVKWMLDVCEKHISSSDDDSTSKHLSSEEVVNNGATTSFDSSHSLTALIKAFGGTQDMIDGVKANAARKKQAKPSKSQASVGEASTDGAASKKIGSENIIFVDDDDIDGNYSPNEPSVSDIHMKGVEPGIGNASSSIDEKMYNCDLCCGKFKTLSNMKRHKICCHNTDKEYKCHYCSAIFCSKPDKLDHEEKTHCDKVRLHHCTYCRKKFRTKFSLVQHVDRIHRGNRARVTCTICNKSFSYSMTLKSHISTVHLGIKNHECDVCGKRFGKKYELEYHLHLKH